jgi:hypothetical protein
VVKERGVVKWKESAKERGLYEKQPRRLYKILQTPLKSGVETDYIPFNNCKCLG